MLGFLNEDNYLFDDVLFHVLLLSIIIFALFRYLSFLSLFPVVRRE